MCKYYIHTTMQHFLYNFFSSCLFVTKKRYWYRYGLSIIIYCFTQAYFCFAFLWCYMIMYISSLAMETRLALLDSCFCTLKRPALCANKLE